MKKIILCSFFAFIHLHAIAGILSEKSIALTNEYTGLTELKDIRQLDFYILNKKSIYPLIDATQKPDLSIYSEQMIKIFFQKLWHPVDNNVSSKWLHDDETVVIVARTSRENYAYFHVYLKRDNIPLITPYTGSDVATYEFGGITSFLNLLN